MEAIAQEKDLYRSEFETFERERSKDADWLRRLRSEGMERFTALGFPTSKDEAWRYTNVAPIVRVPFRRGVAAPAPAAETLAGMRLGAAPHPQLVFINGRIAPELSTVDGTPGLRLTSLKQALARDPEALQPYLGRIASDASHAFAALNSAFLEDGAYVRIARGAVVESPIHLVFISEPGSQPAVAHPRNLVVAEPESQASIVETWTGAAGQIYFTNAVTEIAVEAGAVLEHYKVQREAESAYHVAVVEARQGRGSNFASHNVSLGGALTRNDINVLLAAEGAECVLNGLFVGGGSQYVDNHTLIDHASPHCTSRELYKGILDGKSRGVFHGKIIVRPDAQKTDAMQTNKNLLLSREALVNSTPALEIRADDVKCRHGSTIGQLDQAALFYLRSRGIAEEDARALLVYGFAADVAGRIRIAPIREGVEAFLGRRLPGAAGLREVA